MAAAGKQTDLSAPSFSFHLPLLTPSPFIGYTHTEAGVSKSKPFPAGRNISSNPPTQSSPQQPHTQSPPCLHISYPRLDTSQQSLPRPQKRPLPLPAVLPSLPSSNQTSLASSFRAQVLPSLSLSLEHPRNTETQAQDDPYWSFLEPSRSKTAGPLYPANAPAGEDRCTTRSSSETGWQTVRYQLSSALLENWATNFRQASTQQLESSLELPQVGTVGYALLLDAMKEMVDLELSLEVTN